MGSISLSFWDMESSGQLDSAGGIGLQTAEMMDPEMLGLNGLANDPNWILDANNDYPRLSWEGTVGQVVPLPAIHWLEGTGTSENPFVITNTDQLILISKAGGLMDKSFIMTDNLDLADWSGTQALIPYFSGHFNGNGFKISNLRVQGAGNLGFFGLLSSDAVVRNLGLCDVSIEGDLSAGSLCARNDGHIHASYSTGSVNGKRVAGGLAGINNGTIDSCYSTCSVTCKNDAGGLVGRNYTYNRGKQAQGKLSYCYSVGAVGSDGQGNFRGGGGLVGENMMPDSVIACFWDIQTSGLEKSSGGSGLTTADLQTASTFIDTGWDFINETANGTEDIWWILEGQDYPRLWWELGHD
jgi:hypothetical protein